MNITEDAKQRVEWIDKRVNLTAQQKKYIEFQIKEAVVNARRQVKNCSIPDVVESAELVACDDQGTPIIGENGEKTCNCAEPKQSHFPDNKHYCLNCWGEWYH